MNRNCHVSATSRVTTRWFGCLVLLVIMIAAAMAGMHFALKGATAAKAGPPVARPAFSSVSVPMFFEPNQGQTDSRVKFLARGSGYGLFLTSDEAVLKLQIPAKAQTATSTGVRSVVSDVIRMRLAGANPDSSVAGVDPLAGKSNYLIGNDPRKWRSNISHFARVEYQNVYPGVDLAYYGNQRQLEYDFRIAPGADPSPIAMAFDGARARLDSGELVLATNHGEVRFHAPILYQTDGDKKTPVTGRFLQLAENRIGFEIGQYDRSRELIIDPTLTYSTYLGGTGIESGPSVAADSGLAIYVAGITSSTDFPVTSDVFQTVNNGATDVFITKINPSQPPASQLVYSTYLGGTSSELNVAGVAVDSGLNVYVAGTTTSSDFPTAGRFPAFQPTASGTHGFLSKLDANGLNLLYSTYLAGNGIDQITGMAIDTKQEAFVTGTTTSTDQATGFPATTNGYQTSSLAVSQFFASKINTVGSGVSSMLYSTYFGGANPAGGQTLGGGIAVDVSGNLYITGGTNFLFDPAASGNDPRTNFPILNAQQSCLNEAPGISDCLTNLTGNTDAFLAKINPNRPNGAGLLYSTYLGGSLDDIGFAVAVDSASNAYVTGETFSTDWVPPASPLPFQAANKGAGDAFIAKIGAPTGNSTIFPLTYFTYLGGSGVDIGRAIAADTVQAAHVAGSTSSADLPVVNTLQPYGQQNDAFVSLISTTGTVGTYLTYLGGGSFDQATGISLDPNQDSNPVFVSGETQSANFPVANPLQANLNGTQQDAFVSLLGNTSTFAYAPNSPTVSPNPASVGNQVTFTFAFINNGPDPASNVIFSGALPNSGFTFSSATATPGGTCQNPANAKVTCAVGTVAAGAQASISVILVPTIGTNSLTVAPSLSANGGPFNSFNPPGTVQVNDFSIVNPPPSPSTVTINAGEMASFTITLTPLPTYDSVISMSNTSLPTGATGTYTSQTVTLNGSSPQTTVLNIATTARPVNTGRLFHGGSLYATWLPVGGLSLLGLGVGAGTRRRRWLIGALLGLIAGIVLLQPACGSNNNTPPLTGGTPAGTYTITITGASGSVSHNAPVTLIVN